jgi:hypothetical protein
MAAIMADTPDDLAMRVQNVARVRGRLTSLRRAHPASPATGSARLQQFALAP